MSKFKTTIIYKNKPTPVIVRYTHGPCIQLHNITDCNGRFLSIGLRGQKEIKQRIGHARISREIPPQHQPKPHPLT